MYDPVFARASSKHCSSPLLFFNSRLLNPARLLLRSVFAFISCFSGRCDADASTTVSDTNRLGSRKYRTGSRTSFSAYKIECQNGNYDTTHNFEILEYIRSIYKNKTKDQTLVLSITYHSLVRSFPKCSFVSHVLLTIHLLSVLYFLTFVLNCTFFVNKDRKCR